MIQGASTVNMETKFSGQKIFHRYVLIKSKKSVTCMNLMIKVHCVIKTIIILQLKYIFFQATELLCHCYDKLSPEALLKIKEIAPESGP